MAKNSLVKTFKSAESTISIVLGVLVVVIIGVLLFRYFRNFSLSKKVENVNLENIATEDSSEKFTGELPTKYVVVAGDSLWKISEMYFGYGYNWGDISAENKLSNPGKLLVGQELIIPNVAVRKPLLTASVTKAVVNPITSSNYSVVKGDNLWNISVRAYQDGFKWVEIAKANNLTNPNVIHVGDALSIPR